MNLNYNVKGTGLSVSDEIRSYIEKRLAHTEKFVGDSTAHADIEVEYRVSEDRQHYRAEFTLATKGEVFRTEAFGDNLHEAIDIATGELRAALAKEKKKDIGRVRRGAGKFKDFIRGLRERF